MKRYALNSEIMKSKTHFWNLFSNVQKFILGTAIVIVFVSLVLYATSVFLDEPKYDDFCKAELYSKQVYSQEECTKVGGLWSPYLGPRKEDDPQGYCDSQFTCRKDYESVREKYSRTASIVAVIAGIIALSAGLFIKVENVSLGLMTGGVFLILYGVMAHWNYLSKYLRLFVLVLVLVLLIWFSYKKFGKK